MKIGYYEHKLGWIAYVEKGFQMIYIYIGAGELSAVTRWSYWVDPINMICVLSRLTYKW